MSSVNKATIIGRMGSDPEIRTASTGSKLCTFSVATSETWKDKTTGEKKEQTEWHRITVFSPGTVDFLEKYAKKGSLVHLEGKICTQKYTDKNGVEKYTTEIRISGPQCRVDLLSFDKKEDAFSPHQYKSASGGTYIPSKDEMDDDIPF